MVYFHQMSPEVRIFIGGEWRAVEGTSHRTEDYFSPEYHQATAVMLDAKEKGIGVKEVTDSRGKDCNPDVYHRNPGPPPGFPDVPLSLEVDRALDIDGDPPLIYPSVSNDEG
jgi:hypothetical protein